MNIKRLFQIVRHPIDELLERQLPYHPDVDKFLQHLIDTGSVPVVGPCDTKETTTFKVNGIFVSVWTSNFPYSYGNIWRTSSPIGINKFTTTNHSEVKLGPSIAMCYKFEKYLRSLKPKQRPTETIYSQILNLHHDQNQC